MAAHNLTGTIFLADGTTNIGSGIIIYVLNKTQDNEQHNGNDTTNYATLTTDSDGAYSVDLELFTGKADGDIIYVTAKSDHKTGYGRVVRSGSSSTVNVTLKEHKPVMNITNFLKQRIIDYQGSNMTGKVTPFYPKGKDLSKTDYPRIAVKQEIIEGIKAGTSSQLQKQRISCLITLLAWGKDGDLQILSITEGSPSVTDNYEGNRLLDFIAEKIEKALRSQFYIQPNYDKDALLQLFYDYELVRSEPLDFDEEEGIWKHEIEIEFSLIKQN